MEGQRPDREGDLIIVGQVVGPHGIRGGLRVKVLTDFRERFDAGQELIIQGVSRKIVHSSWHKDQVRVRLRGLNDRTESEGLKWENLSVPASSLPDLDEDEFYTQELIGLKAVHVDGTELGTVTEVISTPAHDVIVIGEAMVPAIHEFVKDIDLEKGVITMEPIEGMFDTESQEEAK